MAWFGGGWFYLKVRGSPESAIASVRSAVDTIDPTLPLLGARSFDEQMNRALTTERMLATLSTGFGVIALLLSAVGLYGVMSFVVTCQSAASAVRVRIGSTTTTLAPRRCASRTSGQKCRFVTIVFVPHACVWHQ